MVLDVSSSNNAEGTVSPAQLIFTPSNWADAQTVTVTAVEDSSSFDDNAIVSIAVNDALSDDSFDDVNTYNIPVLFNNNDFSFVVSETAVEVAEDAGVRTVTLALATPVSSDVVLELVSSDTAEATVSTSSLTFTPTDWNVSQSVMITGVDDDHLLTDSAVITVSVNDALSDDNYDAVADGQISVTLVNDDAAGIALSTTELTISENNGSGVFDVSLTAQPQTDVVVDLSSDNTAEATVFPAQMTFTPANWNTPQAASVTGVDDSIVAEDSVDISLAINAMGSDDDFDAVVPVAVTVNLTNDDLPGAVQFASASYLVTENTTYQVVTVTRTGGDFGAASVDYATSDDTASAGSDYTGITGTLEWGAGDSAIKAFALPITDDLAAEGNETLNLTLSNTTGVSLGGQSATTVTIRDDEDDFNVEQLTTFDLQNTTLTFTWNGGGYERSVSAASVYPTDTTGHTVQNLGDESSVEVTFGNGFTIPFFGIDYSSLHFHDNGLVSMAPSETGWSPTVTEFFANQPRIAIGWQDFNPNDGGTISYAIIETSGEERVVITFDNVPRYGSTPGNLFAQLEIFQNGTITITHLGTTGMDSGIVGLANGIGLPEGFIPSDLSEDSAASTSVTLTASATAGGSVYPSGAFEVNPSDFPYDIAAVADVNYAFVSWAGDTSGLASTSSPVTTIDTTTADSITAQFISDIPDTTAPSVPTGLAVSNLTQTSLTLTWTASTDDAFVSSYEVFLNGSSQGTTSSTSFDLTGLSDLTNYSLTVLAEDSSGNRSTASAAYLVQTLPYTQLPFYEAFETAGTIVDDPAAWDISGDGSFVVDTAISYSGSYGLSLTGSSSGVSSLLRRFTDDNSIVWVDFYLQPVLWAEGLEGPTLDNSTAVGFYIDSQGKPVVFDGDAWQTLSSAASLSSSAFSRVSFRVDYTTSLWALWVDGVLVAENIAFNTAASSAELTRFELGVYGEQTAGVDALAVTADAPSGLEGVGPPVGTFAHFVSQHSFANAQDALPTANPDLDRFSNILEYALALDPLVANQDGMPTGVLVDDNGGTWMALDYRKNLEATDIVYSVQETTDLIDWNPLSPNGTDVIEETLNSDIDGDGKAALVRVRMLLAPTDMKRFMRLHILVQ